MKNDYEIRGETVAIFLHRRDGTKLETIIDLSDLPLANKFQGVWISQKDKDTHGYYAVGASHGPLLHRWLTNAPEGAVVDHVNHDTLDNRRSINLQVCTETMNQLNRKSAQLNSKTKIRGVHWRTDSNRWTVTIQYHGVTINLGSYKDVEIAKQVSKAAINMAQKVEALQK